MLLILHMVALIWGVLGLLETTARVFSALIGGHR